MSDSGSGTKKVLTKVRVWGAFGTAMFIVLLIWGPWWIEGHHLKEDGKLIPSAGIIVTGFRTMLVAVVAGLVAAAGLWYTRKKHELEQRQFEHTQQQFAESQKQFETTLRETQTRDAQQTELAREEQVTGRYVEAIKLLGSEKLHERLGGIYSLERIMNDSEKDHETIVEVLAAFIRLGPPEDANVQPAARIKDDAQAALTVLGRRPDRPEHRRINLRGADLRHANLVGSRLPMADFNSADLSQANADGATLDRADFARARLVHAQLRDASLQRVDFCNATLKDANLARSDLRGSGFLATRMEGATIDGANLMKAVYLTEGVVLSCLIDVHTKLSEELANNPKVQERR
ncbi:pentapeptide repeat-containing protein [Streptomyces longisporoflavus]|uniref:pentapeptide repeat-containing protein n=1 Tax=Streptomyces longisporoflavus TaxID=28044 RepID=UPI00167D4783|nr:pentapeptide repeat-containing protein [Streptomyces longisporoflavus]